MARSPNMRDLLRIAEAYTHSMNEEYATEPMEIGAWTDSEVGDRFRDDAPALPLEITATTDVPAMYMKAGDTLYMEPTNNLGEIYSEENGMTYDWDMISDLGHRGMLTINTVAGEKDPAEVPFEEGVKDFFKPTVQPYACSSCARKGRKKCARWCPQGKKGVGDDLFPDEANDEYYKELGEEFPAQGSEQECAWWAGCDNEATTTEPHPILGDVPICDRCVAKLRKIEGLDEDQPLGSWGNCTRCEGHGTHLGIECWKCQGTGYEDDGCETCRGWDPDDQSVCPDCFGKNAIDGSVTEGDKPYATMDDGPEDYLYKKGKKQKLVGSADNDPEEGEEQLEEAPGDIYNIDGYIYRQHELPEEDVVKLWHYMVTPEGEEVYIDYSPYQELDKDEFAARVAAYRKGTMDKEIREMQIAAGIVIEDCDESEDAKKNDDGECSPFTHADDNVAMVREEEWEGTDEEWDDMDRTWVNPGRTQEHKPCPTCGELSFDYEITGECDCGHIDEDFLVPPKDLEDGHYEDDDDWKMQGGEDNIQAFDRDMSDSEPFMDEGADSGNEHASECSVCKDIAMVPGNRLKNGDVEWNCENCGHYEVGGSWDPREDDGIPKIYEGATRKDFRMVADLISKIEDPALRQSSAEDHAKMFALQNPRFNKELFMKAAGAELTEQGPGDIMNSDDDEERIIDVGDDEDYETYDFNDDFDDLFGGPGGMYEMNELRRLAGLEQLEEKDIVDGADAADGEDEEVEVDEGFDNPGSDIVAYEIGDEKAYYVMADILGAELDFGPHDEILVPKARQDEIEHQLDMQGFAKGRDFAVAGQMFDDLQNGYDDRAMVDGPDFFPGGATSSPSRELGPAGAKHGDNPMRTPMASIDKEDVYESMKLAYRRYRRS